MRRVAQWLLGCTFSRCEVAYRVDKRRDQLRLADGESVVAAQLYIVVCTVVLGSIGVFFERISFQQLTSVLSGVVFIVVFSCCLARRYFRVSGARQARAMCAVLWGGQVLKVLFFLILMLVVVATNYLELPWVVLGVAMTQLLSTWLGFRKVGV